MYDLTPSVLTISATNLTVLRKDGKVGDKEQVIE